MASATDPAAPDAPDDLTRLKTLLFREEQTRLSVIEGGLSRLDNRVGSADRLVETTSEIIVEALRRAEVERHRELSGAIAPVVVASIRNEIRNSRDEMVDVLYPLTGRMVKAAVANAIRELAASLNQRIDALTSADRWKLQLRAWMIGRPVSELALASAPGAPVRLLFMERGSGQVIADWSISGEDHRNELVGGLIAAIMNFGRDALGDAAGDLQTLEFGGRQVYLRASAHTIVAAECNGALSAEQREALDSGFLALLETYQETGNASEESLAGFASALAATGPAKRKSSGLGLKIVAALALVAIAWGLWTAGSRWWKERSVSNVLRAATEARPELAAYPLTLDFDHGASKITLRGLSPAGAEFAAIIASLKQVSAPYSFSANTISVVAASQLAAIRQQAAALEKQLAASRTTTATLQGELTKAQTVRLALDTRLAAVSQQFAAMSKNLASIQSAVSANTANVTLAQKDRSAIASSLKTSAASLDRIKADLAALAKQSATASKVTQLEAGVAQARTTLAELMKTQAGITTQIKSLSSAQARLDTPNTRLLRKLQTTAIFFAGEKTLRDPVAMQDSIAAIARLLLATSQTIRVVGYADASGPEAGNNALALDRARLVAGMLVKAGVPQDRLITIGRGASDPIAENDGAAATRNRRVVFEPVYEGETK